ncbi:thiaminase II [Paracoccus ravus]|uniref:thiaminase II n=1 Tax=Paracoccus ravus TaxID=2447760 RepID=UPI00106ED8C4|nr:thiaminase II [Paracoccus ravus]
MSYGQTFSQWRDAAPDWRDYTHHPFVEGMREGTLPRADFLTYLVQDYLFLIHFSRAWALAVVKAGDLEEMRACAATVHALLDHEMSLHVQTCAAAGIDVEAMTRTPEAMTNIAYTRYVMDAGLSGDFLDLLAALMPCVLGYGEIGTRLQCERLADTPYMDWIETYAGAEYQAACASAGRLLDEAIRKRLGPKPEDSPRWQQLAGRFATATRLEVAFWGLGKA